MKFYQLKLILILGALLVFVVGSSASTNSFAPRRVLFAKCDYADESTVKPMAVFMTCANTRGICEVRAGTTHTLRAVFVPKINSSNVDSYVRWNSWIDVPLPGQTRDACGNSIECPVEAKSVTRFTYDLGIQNFWPREEYPVIWSLTDRDTGLEVVCFRFKINIV